MFKRIVCPICSKRYSSIFNAYCPRCHGIDFEIIENVYIVDVEDKFHNEIEEDRTMVASYEYNGKEHVVWEKTTNVNQIYDGRFYTFYIQLQNGDKLKRTYKKEDKKCIQLLEIAKELSKLDKTTRINILNTFSDGVYIYTVEELLNEYNAYTPSIYFDSKLDDFIEMKMEFLQECSYEQFVMYIRKVLLCLLSTIQEGEIFKEHKHVGVQFVQKLDVGLYGFVLSQTKDAVTKKEIRRCLRLKRLYDYKKLAFIFTSSLDKKAYSYIGHDEILLWDLNCIEQCLYQCYEKILAGDLNEN